MTSFANAFEPSISAAAAVGPNAGTPSSARRSTRPATDPVRLHPRGEAGDVVGAPSYAPISTDTAAPRSEVNGW